MSVGHDSRVSGPRMKKDVIAALTRAGINCYDFGLMSTPGMFMSCVDEKLHCDAAIQLTASHHPFNRNGLKFFTKEGGLEESDITALLENAQDGKRLPDAPGAKAENTIFFSVYAAMLVDMVRKNVNAEDYEHPPQGLPYSGGCRKRSRRLLCKQGA